MTTRRALVAVAAVTASALAAVLGVGGAAGAATASAELIVRPGTTTPLGAGGSATPYAVVLPSGASCPGDTAHDGYHVFSYLVPEGTSPTEVSFKTGLPGRWFGYIADGAYYGAVNTAESTGQVVGLPRSFTWSRLTPADLFASGAHTAAWQGGIACADVHGVVTNFWNSTIRFTGDTADPGGFTWAVQRQQALPGTSSRPVALWVGIGLVVIASGAAAYALRLRRRNGGASSGNGADVDARFAAGPVEPPGPDVSTGASVGSR